MPLELWCLWSSGASGALEQKFQNVERQKKSAWTDLDRVSQRQVSLMFFSTTGHGSALTRGAVDATPFAVAFSLTFSLVKN